MQGGSRCLKPSKNGSRPQLTTGLISACWRQGIALPRLNNSGQYAHASSCMGARMTSTKFWLCFTAVFAFASGMIVGMGSADVEYSQKDTKYITLANALRQDCYIHWHQM